MKRTAENVLLFGFKLIPGPRAFIKRVADEKILSGKLSLCGVGQDVVLYPASKIHNNQSDPKAIFIGSHSRVYGQLLVLAHGGGITVGEYCFIGENSRVWSGAAITIWNRVLISHDVNIHDTVSHSLSAASRHKHFREISTQGHPQHFDDLPPQAPIVIEDDVWIGFNSTVMKGVTIGRGAVIGAASVVTKDVEPFTVVVGSPARVIGKSKP